MVVVSYLPRAGLGNKLFVWARGLCFAHENGFAHYTTNWNHYSQFMIAGRGLRRPTYARALNSKNAYLSPRFLRSLLFPKIIEPEIAPHPDRDKGHLYVFSKIPHWRSYFEGLEPHREMIRRQFLLLTRDNPKEPRPEIGIHVRLGDFKKVDEGQSFSAQGTTRTPMEYFVEVINSSRMMANDDVSVSIFSDGSDDELRPLLEMKNTKRFRASSDVAELVALSRSKVIVTSASSTFGLWAGFMSDAVVIHHPDHFHGKTRGDTPIWEGPWEQSASDLRKAVAEALTTAA